MLIQIGSKDQAKEVMDIEHIGSKPEDMSSEIELLKSQLLFDKAIASLNMHVSLFAKGAVLTEERYKSGVINIMPYELRDSSLIDVPISISHDRDIIHLNYMHGGQKYSVSGRVNKHIVNKHFDVIIKVSDLSAMKQNFQTNEFYFVFNSTASLSARLLPDLQVLPINEAAKTIQILYKGHDPQLCHDKLKN